MGITSAANGARRTAARYFDNISPITGQAICEIPRSDAEDVERALDAAHAAKDAWGRTAAAERAAHPEQDRRPHGAISTMLATVETWDNGKPIRETMAADCRSRSIISAISPAAIRAQEGSLGEIDDDTVAYHYHEPLGVVGQIIPWNFPILMAVWKLAPALAAGNCVVLKPAEQTPVSILVLHGADRRPAAPGRAQRRQRLRPRGRQAARVEQRASPRSRSPARRRPAG